MRPPFPRLPSPTVVPLRLSYAASSRRTGEATSALVVSVRTPSTPPPSSVSTGTPSPPPTPTGSLSPPPCRRAVRLRRRLARSRVCTASSPLAASLCRYSPLPPCMLACLRRRRLAPSCTCATAHSLPLATHATTLWPPLVVASGCCRAPSRPLTSNCLSGPVSRPCARRMVG
ncbi:hypothetical protein DAI22_10g052400 [Oryza sativa Japonica Group]|nr:hypothetical protein DAI22_10g052400 [Oryza sativa Japonica Group]